MGLQGQNKLLCQSTAEKKKNAANKKHQDIKHSLPFNGFRITLCHLPTLSWSLSVLVLWQELHCSRSSRICCCNWCFPRLNPHMSMLRTGSIILSVGSGAGFLLILDGQKPNAPMQSLQQCSVWELLNPSDQQSIMCALHQASMQLAAQLHTIVLPPKHHGYFRVYSERTPVQY